MLEGSIFHDTSSGTPQGGIISPTLANIVLAGLEEVILNQCSGKTRVGKPGDRSFIRNKVNVVRYADDLMVTCHKKYAGKQIIEVIDKFLSVRGLTLNKKKTKVTKITDGFDFLGFNFRM